MSADAEKYAQWIVDNKDKKGTSEFETVAKAYQLAKSSTPESFSDNPLKYIKAGVVDLGDIGRGILGEGAKYVGRVTPGVTGEQLQSKVESSLSPKQMPDNRMITSKDLANVGNFITDTGASFAGPAALGAAASKIPQAAKYAELLSSGGFNMGDAATKSKLANFLMRTGTGATEGYGLGTLINPDEAGAAAGIQGGLAGLTHGISELAQPIANRLMHSAIKPSDKYLRADKVDSAIQTMLDYGVNPTQKATIWGKGLDTLHAEKARLAALVDELVKGSPNVINKQAAINEVEKLRPQMVGGGATANELSALDKYLAEQETNPILKGQETISAPAAQEIKQGLYKKIGSNAYLNPQSTPETVEGAKAYARGLRKDIERAIPEIAPINADETRIFNALSVAERKALNEANKDIMGVSWISPNTKKQIAMLADRSAGFKAILARMVNDAGNKANALSQLPVGTLPAVAASQGEQ